MDTRDRTDQRNGPDREGRARGGADTEGPATADPELHRLRQLLLGAEERRIAELERRLSDPDLRSREAARVLPHAIEISSKDGEHLGRALTPTIERAIEDSVRRNPRVLADAIFPIIGPAVRLSIANALSQMMQRFNQALEESLSVRSLGWRLEARRTGRPLAEVILLHSLVYRVEQLFLIHAESGLLLLHVVAPSVDAHDADMVSGMLSAIERFVQDSFSESSEAPLQQMRVGDVHVVVERGPGLVLAAVVRGLPPESLRSQLQSTLERVHARSSAAIAAFAGDAAPFEPVRADVETCLSEKRRERKQPVLAWSLAGCAILLLASWFTAQWWLDRDARRSAERRFVEIVSREPGFTLVDHRVEEGTLRLVAMRDPLAVEPAALYSRAGLASEQVSAVWVPVLSSDPALALARARSRLEPPPSVEMELADAVLRLRGSAESGWIERARLLAPSIPGIERVDVTMLALLPAAGAPR